MVRAGTITAIAILGLAVTAGAAEKDSRSEMTVRFGTTAPATSTSLQLRVLYKHPRDPAAKPPPLESARFELPEGTRIDGAALPSCDASDEELRTGGRDACPRASRLGTGTFTAVTGFGPPADPFQADVTLFNGGDEVIELVTLQGTETVAGYDRLKIRGRSLVVDRAPATPGGPPEGRTVPREIVFSIPVNSGPKPFLTTPPTCPPGRAWVTRGVFTFTDGGASTVSSETPCSPAAAQPTPPRARLMVVPRRVRSNRRVRYRFRAVSSDHCARHAVISFAGRRKRTDGRGRASLRLRLARPGVRVARLAKRGCRGSVARVRVVR